MKITPNTVLTKEELSKTHYVYRITNTRLNKYYYGSRYNKNKYGTTLQEDLEKYKSSSKDKDFKQDQKENPQDYKYKIVRVLKSKDACLMYECILHWKFDVKTHPSFYNRSNQTSNGWNSSMYILTDKQKESMSKRMKGSVICKDSNNNTIITTKDDPRIKSGEIVSVLKGVKKSDSHRNKMKINRTGSKLSKTTRKRIGDTKRGSKSCTALKINIYNSNNKIVHKCYGNFFKIIEEFGYPRNKFSDTYKNKSFVDYELNLKSKNQAIKSGNIKYQGWYCRIIN